MPIQLDGSAREALHDALTSAFDEFELERLMRYRLDVDLRPLLPTGITFDETVFRLIEWLDQHGRVDEFVNAAFEARPADPKLQAIARRLGVPTQDDHGRLERLVKASDSFVDLAAWQTELTRAEQRVCRIESGGRPVGTGFLVGPDAVLTCYHIVQGAIDDPASSAQYACRFDVGRLDVGPVDDGTEVSSGEVVRFDEAWLIDASPYSEAEAAAVPDRASPRHDELDYALVRLARRIGDLTAADGEPRGWFHLAPQPIDVEPTTAIAILQFLEGSTLQLAFTPDPGLHTTASGNRIRYQVPTSVGSSGAPIFDADWRLIGMHHLGTPDYGQGIPVSLIASQPAVAAYLGETLGEDELDESEPVPGDRPGPRPETGRDQVDWRPDEPAAIDMLGRLPVANALATQLRRLARDYPGYPFLVHIDGRWGAGKSTLLGFVKASVSRPVSTSRAPASQAVPVHDDAWTVIDYDAWRQMKVGPPWLTLLNALRDAVFARQPWWKRQRLRAAETLRLVGRSTWLSVVAWLTIVALALTLFVALLRDNSTSELNDVIKLVGGVIGLVAMAWALSTAASSHVLLRSRRAAERFESLRADPMEDLASHFQWVLSQSTSNVVLVIDDLDRCQHDHVVELLESVQKLMRDRTAGKRSDLRNLFFIVAADGRWIRESFQRRYEAFADSVGEAGRPLGTLFLDKLFQLSMPIPELHHELQERYLRSLVEPGAGRRRGPSEDAAHGGIAALSAELSSQLGAAVGEQVLEILDSATPLEQVRAAPLAIERLLTEESVAQTEHRLQRFAPLLDRNPRSMKRFVMAYSMLRVIRTAEANTVPLEPLALWTIVVTRWPDLADVLRRNPDAVRYFRVAVDEQPAEIPADLRPLFAEPTEELRRVMNHPEAGPLDAEAIRRCCGLDPFGADDSATNRLTADSSDVVTHGAPGRNAPTPGTARPE